MGKRKREARASAPRCPTCNSLTRIKKVEIDGFQIRVYKCKKCGFTITHPDDSELLFLKDKGIKTSVGKLGRQTIIRIPAKIREIYSLDKKKHVKIKPKGKKKFEVEII